MRVAVSLIVLLLVAVILRTAWVSDDAFITFRTVENALDGHGLRWNVAERVQSYTHPLWMLLLLPAVQLIGSPYLASLLLSFAFTAAVIASFALPVRGRPWAVMAGLTILLFSKAFVDYSTGGLENPLSHALLAGLMVAAASPGAGSALLLGVLVGLIGLSRADLVLIAVPIALGALASPRIRQPASGSPPASGIRHPASGIRLPPFPALFAFALGLAPLAGWTLFSIAYYGVPFPNTAYAKLSTGVPQEMLTRQGLRYLGESFERDPVTLPVIVAAIVVPIVASLVHWVARTAVRGRRAALQPPSQRARTPRGVPHGPDVIGNGSDSDDRSGGDDANGRLRSHQSGDEPPGALFSAWPVSIGLLIYVAYVVRIGGDFMSGRFLAAPLVVSVFLLHRRPWPRRAPAGLAIMLAVTAVGLTAREPSVALLVGPSTLEFPEIWTPHGVVDERSFYFDRTAFLTREGPRTEPAQEDLQRLVADVRGQHPRTVVYQTVGMVGYYVGPDRHIIDTLALCDPLLARLPAVPPWRVGHYQRPLPEGYWESVDTDTNRIVDPEIAALYDRIRLATRGPLWTWERWGAIGKLNGVLQ